MKHLFGIFLCALSVMSVEVMADPFAPPQLINVSPENVFIPKGFDNNDNVQVVVHGFFPDTCYRVAQPAKKVDVEKREILIANRAHFFTDAICLRMTVPYTVPIDLDHVPAGDYKVFTMETNGSQTFRSNLSVAKSQNSGPDDFLYAPVTDTFFEKLPHGGRELVVRGEFETGCFELDELKTSAQVEAKVLLIQPIVRQLSGDCANRTKTFEKRVKLGNDLKGPTLVHIRTLNGQSINKVVTF